MTRPGARCRPGPVLLLVLLGCFVAAAPAASRDDRAAIWRQSYLMGTRATLAVATTDRAAGLTQLELMLQRLEAADRELSTWRPDSQLSQLNRHPVGHRWPAPSRLCQWLGAVADWHRQTEGAFDPAVGALTSPAGASTATRVGFSHLLFEPRDCAVTRQRDVKLDAGGFGKGAALDDVRRTLGARSHPWLIDLGGQVAVSGVPQSGPWTVDIAHPLDRTRAVAQLDLARGSLAVSGGSERDRVVDGVRVGHILDPRSGQPIARAESVIVWHANALAADALSTALFVMGSEAGLAWADRHGVAACFIVPVGVSPSPEGAVRFRESQAFRSELTLR